jgi:hypothetical protein
MNYGYGGLMAGSNGTLYWLTGQEGYWVIQRAGYDIISFTDRKEAEAEYARLLDLEEAQRRDCPFAR